MMPAMNENVFDFPHLGASSGTLKVGIKSAEVADLQRNLQRLGFVSIRADGLYDQTVARIVSLIQKALMRPETGEVDSFTDASITRALDSAQSMEALRIGVVAQEWSKQAATTLMQQPQQVQLVTEEVSVLKQPMFWLAAAGLLTGVLILFKKTEQPIQPTLTGTEDDGVDDPEEFFHGVEAKPKRKKPRKRKQKALAEVSGESEIVSDEEADAADEAIDVTADTVVTDAPARDEAGHFLPRGESLADALADAPKPKKPKKPRKRKTKALAESAPAPTDEIVGDPGDPDAED